MEQDDVTRYKIDKDIILNYDHENPPMHGSCCYAEVVEARDYDATQRALDAERERVKELEEWQRVVVGTGTDQEAVVRMAATEYTKTAVQCWKDENAKLTAKLATLQAQLAQPIRVCQGCGRVSRDGWVTARYECNELHGSLQCPDCQCIDLEINTAKELAALCTQAQAQLRQLVEAILLADERGQGLPFKEAMDAAAKAINWNSLPPHPTEERHE